MTVSDAIVEGLIDWGVEVIFGLPGDGINGFVEALRKARDKIRYIHVRHEEAAAMAAVGYAKFSGKLGVCFSTAAPGAVHMLNGLYDAKIDRAPVLAITGMTYHDLIGTHYLQDINQDYLFQDVALFNQRIMGPAHAESMIELACRAALGNRGVAHLAIPIDYQVAEMSSARRSKKNVAGHASDEFVRPVRIPPREHLERAAHLLRGKRKIAILAGSGARGAGEELLEVAEVLGAPIIKALLGKDVIPDDSPFTTGGIGVVGTRPSCDVLETCDAILIVGSSFPYMEFLPKPGQAVGIQIDELPERIGLRYPVEMGLVGDAKATLRELIPLLPEQEDQSFLHQAQEGMRDWWALMEERGTQDGLPMKPEVVAWNLGQVLHDDAIICGDSGTVTTWIARMQLRGRQNFSFSGTMCSMAAALPYSIGAQTAYPNRQVVAFTGDGSMSMMMGDFVTLAQHHLPVKVVVMKNNSLSLIEWEQMVYLGNPEYGVDLMPIDFVKVAEACGARGVRIEQPGGCQEQLRSALAMEGPVLIEAVVDSHEPPQPPKITRAETKHLAEALARGEENRVRIGLTIGRHMIDESTMAASPYGFLGRISHKLGLGGHQRHDEEGDGSHDKAGK